MEKQGNYEVLGPIISLKIAPNVKYDCQWEVERFSAFWSTSLPGLVLVHSLVDRQADEI